MRAVAVTNQKGGSGKTATVVNMAAALAESGRRRVVVVDLDPQANATAWLGVQPGPGLVEVFTDGADLADLVQSTAVAGVSVVPSSAALVRAEASLGANGVGGALTLREALHGLEGLADLVLVDTPPALGMLPTAALVACSEVLLPVSCDPLALVGLVAVVQRLDGIRREYNPALRLVGILPVRVDARTRLSGEVVAELRQRFGRHVLNAEIPENVRVSESAGYRQPVTMYASSSRSAEAYRRAAAELLRRKPKRGGES